MGAPPFSGATPFSSVKLSPFELCEGACECAACVREKERGEEEDEAKKAGPLSVFEGRRGEQGEEKVALHNHSKKHCSWLTKNWGNSN